MKISVITPSLNAAATMQQTLDSVWAQSYKNYEVIVLDAGSKDGTKEILERNSSRIAYWHSQKDKGTTDAANTGITKSTGDLLILLNADDCLHAPDTFEKVVKEFTTHPEADVLCTSLRMIDRTGFVKPYINPSNAQEMRRRGSLHLPGAFFRRKVFQERRFSSDVEVANDYELFAYLTQKTNFCVRVSDLVSVDFSLEGRTNNPKYEFSKINECFVVRRKYYGFTTAWKWYLWDSSIALLRKMHIRPFNWSRRVRQIAERSRAN